MNNQKKFLITIAVLGVLFFVNQSLSRNMSVDAIKASNPQPVSDEQQGIDAVRTAKASVVDIIGVNNNLSTSTLSAVATNQGSPSVIYGTGFVMESDGLIVSNNHVVSDNTLKYWVILADGTVHPAKILNLDKYDDVALLKIDAANLTPAKLGDSDALETGQTVFAIGNTLGEYQYTVSRGVVSAVNRSVDEGDNSGIATGRLHNMIQTDAAINPGNSGGPLINLNGEVIGMNTLIDTSGSGLGFAVSVNTIKDAVRQIKMFGKVSRPYVGIRFINIDPSIQIAKGLTVSGGALVTDIISSGPAEQAGIMSGDIITSINNEAVTPNNAIDTLLDSYQSGNQVTFNILRNGRNIKISMMLGQLP
ncbi:MAG: trypsin-like peptidase domain-containing protein [Candidatus Doudnabacteria bacterium]|nr:trypsin-like peptidase domain-containing protein [Candidatus Doudnabacteria bacterium]